MSNINFNCDVCGREVQGFTFVNGMKLCAKCYQETFGETDKDRKVADLQSQLQQANEIINNPDTLIFQQQQLIDNLEKTIEEKNKEISNLNGLVRERDKQIKNLKTNKKRVIEHKNKTKISFAVEQLEKVKKFFIEEHRDEEMDTDYIITKDAGEIADYILDRINKLKGEK